VRHRQGRTAARRTAEFTTVELLAALILLVATALGAGVSQLLEAVQEFHPFALWRVDKA
jgi:hypothetical protein